MTKYFCVSDVHSFFNELLESLRENGFEHDNGDHHLVICGDLFDRGPDSVKCFDFVKDLQERGRLHYVRGNHEDLLCDLYHDILNNSVGHHHFSNGTVRTAVEILGLQSIYDIMGCDRDLLDKKLGEVLDFFQENCLEYFEVADHIFVHGWLPCISNDMNMYHARKEFTAIYDEWSNEYDSVDRDIAWESARWINGMLAWSQGMRIPGKTVVCGHWHTSFGHAILHGKGTEFGIEDSCFDIFKDDGIIALDACTAFSKKINCFVLEVNDEEESQNS